MAAPTRSKSDFNPRAFIQSQYERAIECDWAVDLGKAPFVFEDSKAPVEFVVLPRARMAEDPRRWSRLGTAFWSDEALAGWTRKIAALQGEKRETSQKSSKPRTDRPRQEPALVRIDRPSGAAVAVLFLDLPDTKLSPFALHTALRESFGGAIKEGIAGLEHGPRSFFLTLQHLEIALQWELLHAFAYLTGTVSWKPARFGKAAPKASQKSRRRTLEISVSTSLAGEEFEERVLRAQVLARANAWVRTLADLPANVLNPGTYRSLAESLAKGAGLKTSFLSTKDLKQLGANGFLSVVRADPHSEAGILRVIYQPTAQARSSRKKGPLKLVLVGKGICFDTGGYNIKTGGSMFGMHGDMTGSALALALCMAFAELKVPFEIQAHLALAENLISPTAYKPNEVVVACDGTAIEVMDTDAEGRMILSDTLALARREKASLVIDFATLTGAAIRALDKRIAAVFSHDPQLAQLAVQCGERSGERAWSFPIGEDYRKELKSEIADILQCAHGNNSDHIYAATFLSHFVGEETPWLHLDLTPASCKGGLGLIETETTGFGVLWASEVIRRVFESGSR